MLFAVQMASTRIIRGTLVTILRSMPKAPCFIKFGFVSPILKGALILLPVDWSLQSAQAVSHHPT